MIKATALKLTKSLLNSIKPEEIIYAEISAGGAMGNAGGVMLYLIETGELMCYETNLFTDRETYSQAEKLLLKHQDTFQYEHPELQNILFDHYYGGMGNNVFINKSAKLEIEEGFFVFRKNDVTYQISSSVAGVFKSVAYYMENSKCH